MISLTFDTDYVGEADLRRFVEQFDLPGEGTFFLWRPFRDLRLGVHELAPHPFYSETRSWSETLDEFENVWGRRGDVIRTHSCVYSHYMGVDLARRGYRATSHTTPLGQMGLTPYRQPWGLWELPIYYMDSMAMTFGRNWPSYNDEPFDERIIEAAVEDQTGLYVFDFHPVHVILNTSSYDQYQTVRSQIVEGDASLFDLAFPGQGCRAFYERLLTRMRDSGVRSVTGSAVVDAAEAASNSIAGVGTR